MLPAREEKRRNGCMVRIGGKASGRGQRARGQESDRESGRKARQHWPSPVGAGGARVKKGPVCGPGGDTQQEVIGDAVAD